MFSLCPYGEENTDLVKELIHNFNKKLPAVLSHYRQSKTSRKYISSEIRNENFLYRIFLKDLKNDGADGIIVSLKVFREIFTKDFNLGFRQPKKDKCQIYEERRYEDFQDTERTKQIVIFIKSEKTTFRRFLHLCQFLSSKGDNILLLYYSKNTLFIMRLFMRVIPEMEIVLFGASRIVIDVVKYAEFSLNI